MTHPLDTTASTDPQCVGCRSFPVACHDCLSCEACCCCGLHAEPVSVPSHEPTPSEIRQRCEAIQETWSDQERRQRAGALTPREWSVPAVRSAIAEPVE